MAHRMKKTGLLIVLCGPSGVGKSTISRRLEARQKVAYIASATTRRKRPGDDAAKKYQFVSRAEFFKRLDQDLFLEYAQVHGNYYGTPKHPALDRLAQGQDVLLEIDVQGALQVRYQYPQALLIFLLPPDEATLLHRLNQRGRDAQKDVLQRFRGAKREISMAKGSRAFDYMVINDHLDTAVGEIVKIMKHKRSGGI